jgi:hypothetical protein
MRACKDGERPCRECWAVLGTVTEALEGLGSRGFGIEGAGPGADAVGIPCFLKYDGGKCFALYILSTLSSSYTC